MSRGSAGAGMRYQAPGWFDRKVMNPLIAGLMRIGVSFWGSRILEVRGRRTGVPRRNPVNPLDFAGKRYLVAPRGHTQWVRNLRAAGTGTLLLGSRREQFIASEIDDIVVKEQVLRAYLRRWKWEVGRFFDGVGPEASPAELVRIAPDHPIFRISIIDLDGPAER